MDYKQALEIIGGNFSKPSKMPWLSFSIPATRCITGSKLHKLAGTTCSECYALKGFYHMPNAKKAMERRFQALSHPRFEEAFIIAIKTAFLRSRTTYKRGKKVVKENRFRWHDSGDLQSLDHLLMLNRIALATPEIDYFIPSRELPIIKAFIAAGHKFAPNFRLRYSFPLLRGKPNLDKYEVDVSTVGRDDDKTIVQCPALKKQGNKCLDCRACWDKNTINYPLH